jgi:phage terminase small subunit
MPKPLTPKQEAFCLAYIETSNASEAYRQAYDCQRMKPETVSRNAKALLDNNKIATRLAEIRQPVLERAQITLETNLND